MTRKANHPQANANLAKPKGLASSRFANHEEGADASAANEGAAEGEEEDYTSAALASVRESLA